MNANAWFDATEVSKDRDYSIPFPRLKIIRELLWRINAEEGLLNIKKFVDAVMVKETMINRPMIKTYYDLLFTS